MGAIKRNGSWETTDFKPLRYTIKFNNDYSELDGLDASRSFSCSPPYSHKPQSLACYSGYSNGESFVFNKKTKRFILSSLRVGGGYTDDTTDTPTMMFGRSKKF